MHEGPVGYQEFRDNGEEFMRYYVELGGLRPDERMLDVASGIGRKTLPLVAYLSERGSYEGFDIVKSGVDWCSEKYTTRYPNFRFQQIDVYNKLYNPEGSYKASEYRFPFPDEHFDFVVLNSVFTHMLAEEVENYFSEVARVSKPGGRSLITFFLLNAESLEFIESGRSTLDLREQFGPARAISRETPQLAVGYDMNFVTSLYEKNRLRIRQPIHFGSWCGRSDYLSYQDIILAVKPPAASR
jgi:SAM-dependent methyltransferase